MLEGVVTYDVVAFDKKTDVMVLRDPHTDKKFKFLDAMKTKKFAGYKLVKDDT